MVSFFSDIVSLNTKLATLVGPYISVFVLVDENTEKYCLPLVKSTFPNAYSITIASGEKNKNLKSCERIWDALTDKMADRKALLINLGGGVISDIGGFAASCYKRGIDFINIPTTLLAMADASVGGKTGIDFNGFKNQIGLFSEAKEVLISDQFLITLDERQLRSGLAEVVKHYLIADGPSFLDFSRESETKVGLESIKKTVAIKSRIVVEDPHEKNIRKKLNFGHTIGHALESYSWATDEPLLHGEAVAYGMAIETYIAVFISCIDGEKAGFICHTLRSVFVLRPLPADMTDSILALIMQDKKNENGKVRMALLDDIGSCKIDVEVSADVIRDAIDLFNNTITIYAR
jgi:3-dehydroquinate synthase